MLGRAVGAGRYVIVETASGSRLLGLNDDVWLVWTDGPEGETLATPAPTHEEGRVARAGEFLLVAYAGPLSIGPVQHLFLEEGPRFREFLLPEGLPTHDRVDARRLVPTEERPDRADVASDLAVRPLSRHAADPRSRTPPHSARDGGGAA